MSVPHVVIIGGGFAGLWAAQALARDPVRVTLIDRQNHHLFQPLLYQVATAGLSGPDIAAPLRHIFRKQRNVQVLLADVQRIDAGARTLRIDNGRDIAYDYLILATGATHAYFGHDEWAGAAPGLKTLEDALGIRRRLLLAFERAELEADPRARESWLSFVIVGGGPTGVELAGTLAEIARHTLKNDFRSIDPAAAKVRLIESGPRVLTSFPEDLSHKAEAQLRALGVEILLGQAVEGIDTEGVRVGAQRIAARTVLWAAGVAASPLAKALNAPLDRAGRVLVEPDLRVPGHREIFVTGDLAALKQDGKPVPGVAAAAKQMGAYAAQSIRAERQGKQLPPFRYRNWGELATIGRKAAVVDLHGFKLWGYPAWLFWLFIHIFFLIGFRNRMMVMIDWAWSYWTYQRNARIILDPAADRTPR
jgi:NADH:ubiquinone reductase (H+-translocating)